MGHHHSFHPYLIQALAFVLASGAPLGVFMLLAGEWFERRKRRHGRAPRPGSRRATVSARFVRDSD